MELWFIDSSENAERDSSELPQSKRLAELQKVIHAHLKKKCAWFTLLQLQCVPTTLSVENTAGFDDGGMHGFYEKEKREIQINEPLKRSLMTNPFFSRVL